MYFKLYAKHQFFCNGHILQCTFSRRLIIADRLAEAGRLGELNTTGDRHLEQLIAVILFQLGNHLCGEDQTAVIHGQKDAGELQGGIVKFFDLFDADHQL